MSHTLNTAVSFGPTEEEFSCDHWFVDADNEGFYGKEECRFCGFTQDK